MTEIDGQLMPERAKISASARPAFHMTGDRARSLDSILETLDAGHGTDCFFSRWMLAWSQRLVITRALASIHDELAASARRTVLLRIEKFELAPRNRFFDPDADGAGRQIDVDRDSVQRARIIGLQELTRTLAKRQGRDYAASRSSLQPRELQHA